MGRKKKAIMAEKIDIRLRIDEDFHGRVVAAAEAEQTTVAAFIRGLIVREFRRREKESADDVRVGRA